LAQSRLSRLQTDLLEAFFRREKRFFLTDGAALAGFHLGHRTTHDLDLFVTSDVLDAGDLTLQEAATEIGGTVERIQTTPHFRRRLVRRESEGVVVDLVFDQTSQGFPDKPVHAGIRVDPPEEILANKLCTLLSRAEIRDIVDVLALDEAGFRVETGVPLAMRKDGGLTPALLAWVLSEIRLGEDAPIPGGWRVSELRLALADLQSRLTRLAYPG
jgi:hypothetical protein